MGAGGGKLTSKLPIAKFECLNCKHSDHRMSARGVGELAEGECPKCGKDMKVVGREAPEWLVEPLNIVGKHFEIFDLVAYDDRMELEVAARNPKRSFRSLMRVAKKKGYLPMLRRRRDELKLWVMKYPRLGKENIVINFLLFWATILSTFTAGYFLLFDREPMSAFLFSGAIMFMLSAHETGHLIAARRNGVESTLPYFIPAPFWPLGTLGAIAKAKSPIPTKEALIEIGSLGPLLGFLVAIPLTGLGLMFSEPGGSELWFQLPIFSLLQVLTFGHIPATVELNPLAFAGWVMLVVTMLNLLPVGQFDGGHVARGLLDRDRHYTLTRVLSLSLIFFGALFSIPLLIIPGFFAFFFFRDHHPGPLDDVSDLSKGQRLLAAATFIVFLLCLPLPAR